MCACVRWVVKASLSLLGSTGRSVCSTKLCDVLDAYASVLFIQVGMHACSLNASRHVFHLQDFAAAILTCISCVFLPRLNLCEPKHRTLPLLP